MKIDIGASRLFTNQRLQAENPTGRPNGLSPFAVVLAGKTQGIVSDAGVSAADRIEKYDFTQITPKAMLETMNSLIRSGQMDLDETSSLAGMIPSPLSKVNYDGTMPSSFEQPVNFFAKIQEGIEGALSRHELQSAESLQRASDALARFQGQTARLNIQG